MIRKAITTRYAGPTATQGGRIVASSVAGRVSLAYDHGVSEDANHRRAALHLAARFQWAGDWIGSGLPDGRRVWVNGGPGGPFVGFTIEARG